MLHLTIAADRIDCWVRRNIVPCDAPSNVNGARDRYVGLHAIGKSLRDQYDSLAAPVPPSLAALVKQLDEASECGQRRSSNANSLCGQNSAGMLTILPLHLGFSVCGETHR